MYYYYEHTQHCAPFHVINEFVHTIPAVISIPHSGTYLTQQMKQNLKPDIVLPNTDWYLPVLYSFLQQLGYTVIVNHTSRYVADVNRSLEDAKGTSYKTNVCYTHTTQGYAMYQAEPDVCELKHRIAYYYQPYHNGIQKLISEKLNYYNQIYFIDLHSFGLDYGADMILGNDFGNTCSASLMSFIEHKLMERGYSVKQNNPFSGGYLTKYYGTQIKSCQSIQIELWYQTYINHRVFGNEEFPKVNSVLFQKNKDKLKEIFILLKDFLLH